MSILLDLPKMRLATESGPCGVCYETDRLLYTHGAHNVDSAICEICLRRLNPLVCPFCRESLGELSVPATIGVVLNTPSCKPFPFFQTKKEDRDPPGAGCGLSISPISQNNLVSVH